MGNKFKVLSVFICGILFFFSGCKKEDPKVIPTVSAKPVTNITESSATAGGEVTSDGGAAVTLRGVCWSKTQNPITADHKTTNGTGTGIFVASLNGLTPATTYYLRAYAVNSAGTAYGDEVSFKTANEAVLDADGNVYHTVFIGTQEWMVENLKVTHYRNGDAIPNVTDPAEWKTLATGAYCNYNNDENNASTYGRLYNWIAVNDSRNIAPYGWHIPSQAEWTTLITNAGGQDIAGSKLKETGTTHWASPNCCATNETGFTALPGGGRNPWVGSFGDIGIGGYWWSSTYNYGQISYFFMPKDANYVFIQNIFNRAGWSVRCIKD